MDAGPIMMAGVFVALAALIVTMIGSVRRDIDKRFDGVDKRFDDVDKRFDGVDKRFDGIDKRLDGIDNRLDGIDSRLRTVEQGLAEAKGKLTFVESYILGRNEPEPGEAPAE